ncbi:hypothetical protein [Goodfellowiella coeruleoviolacea]|nr:hypothetical protein [Goodfellowiella coeruleoviolacea]
MNDLGEQAQTDQGQASGGTGEECVDHDHLPCELVGWRAKRVLVCTLDAQ